jgi:hypothetical protein
MLEDEHPGLEKDPIHRPPLLTECDSNLTEYTNKFLFYITAERLKHRTFTEKEQVLHYIRGIDIVDFQPSIAYVNSLLDTWSQAGLNPKCQLRSLPKTITKFFSDNKLPYPVVHTSIVRTCQYKLTLTLNNTDVLQDIMVKLQALEDIAQHSNTSTETAIVKYATNNTNSKKNLGSKLNHNKFLPNKDSLNSADVTESRKSVDVFCDACGGHGHRWKNCDYLAKMITCLDYISAITDANKKALLDTYRQEQSRRRKMKQLTAAGRARMLKDSGDADGLYQFMQDMEGYTFDGTSDYVSGDEE